MKNVEYTGPEVNLGRFGVITKGTHLRLTEQEWDKVSEDKRFKLLEPQHSKEELEVFARIKPYGTGPYDLRTVPWEHPQLFNTLLARSSKSKLLTMLHAIYVVGGDAVPRHSEHDDRMWLVDHVVAAARKLGWTTMDRAERVALPVFDPAKHGVADVSSNSGATEAASNTVKVPAKRKRKRSRAGATA